MLFLTGDLDLYRISDVYSIHRDKRWGYIHFSVFWLFRIFLYPGKIFLINIIIIIFRFVDCKHSVILRLFFSSLIQYLFDLLPLRFLCTAKFLNLIDQLLYARLLDDPACHITVTDTV